MLTFENDKENEKLDIHTDLQGLKELRTLLDSLINQTERRGHEHIHLMTKEWGGPDAVLTSEKQHPKNELFNHVKIFCWREVPHS